MKQLRGTASQTKSAADLLPMIFMIIPKYIMVVNANKCQIFTAVVFLHLLDFYFNPNTYPVC